MIAAWLVARVGDDFTNTDTPNIFEDIVEEEFYHANARLPG